MAVGHIDVDVVQVLVDVDLYCAEDARVIDVRGGRKDCHLLVVAIGDERCGVLERHVQFPHRRYEQVVGVCSLE